MTQLSFNYHDCQHYQHYPTKEMDEDKIFIQESHFAYKKLVNILPEKALTRGGLGWTAAEMTPGQTAGIWGTVSIGLKKDSLTRGLPKNCCI